MNNDQMFINGEWVGAESARTMRILNPSTGELLGKVPLAGKEDVDKAVNAARDALPGWSKMMQADRVKALYRLAAALRDHTECPE
jgi:acyl-CoA reductase-like NAD-dependent aldehyde dehydrogenase